MPRPVCVPCEREMTVSKVGAVVQINAMATRGAYQQWRADVYRCMNCGHEVVARYAEQPSWQHFLGDARRDRPDVVVDEILPARPASSST